MGEISGTGWKVILGTVGLLVIVFFEAMILSPEPNASFADSAAALALITGAAVAIERILETGWTLVGQRLGKTWPRGTGPVWTAYVDVLNDSLTPYLRSAEKIVDDLEKAGAPIPGNLDALTAELVKLKARLASADALTRDLAGQAPEGSRVAQLAVLATDISASLSRAATIGNATVNTVIKPSYDLTIQALDDVKGFLGTFGDNPGRRLISLGLGAVCGMTFAGALGLDLFQAILKTPPTPGLHWGIAATGLVIGLGSSPTHEVIRAVQEFKKNLKS